MGSLARVRFLACAAAVALAAIAACGRFEATEESPADGGAVDGAVDASSDPDADGAAEAAPRCPPGCPGTAGPCAVRYNGGGASFCIDSTEVTEADYAAYVTAGSGTTRDVGAPCGAVTVTTPAVNRGGGSLPVTGVTFCEARAYCAFAGKRLCGHVDGGVVADGQYSPTQSQWYGACSGGTSAAVILSGTCALDAGSSPHEAGTTCEGAARGLFDMVGNVWEWIDAPRSLAPDGGGPYGSFVGGSYTNLPWYSCDTVSSLPGVLDFQAQDVGFRCCSP